MPILHPRPYRPDDESALYRICLETGDSGQDATHLYQDPMVLGHVYAGPYGRFQPELAFVIEDDQGVCGYVIGALDSAKFEDVMEREWWPDLRGRYPKPDGASESWTPDQRIANLMYGRRAPPDDLMREYPSHLHIDLLPRAQGGGNGRRLMHALLDRLTELGSPGVHLGVGTRNERAVGFYRHLGFQELSRGAFSITFAMKLPRD